MLGRQPPTRPPFSPEAPGASGWSSCRHWLGQVDIFFIVFRLVMRIWLLGKITAEQRHEGLSLVIAHKHCWLMANVPSYVALGFINVWRQRVYLTLC